MKCEIYEQELTKQGVQWEYVESIPLESIDAHRGLKNQARIDCPLDEDLVSNYAKSMKDGSNFPALVVYSTSRKYIPLDGNHRLSAYGVLKLKTCDAYVVNSKDPLVLDRIAWSFNNHVNGARIPQATALIHAVGYVRKYGWKKEDAAREWGVSTHAVIRKHRVLVLRDILDTNNQPHNKVSDDVVYEMSVFETIGEDVFLAAFKVVAGSGATHQDIQDLVKKVRSAKTHANKMEAITEFETSDRMTKRYAETKGGQIQRKSGLPRDRLDQQLDTMLRLVEAYPDRKSFQPGNKSDTTKVRRKAEDICRHLTVIFGLGTAWQEGTT